MLKRMPRTIAAEQSLKSGLFKLRDIAACAYGNGKWIQYRDAAGTCKLTMSMGEIVKNASVEDVEVSKALAVLSTGTLPENGVKTMVIENEKVEVNLFLKKVLLLLLSTLVGILSGCSAGKLSVPSGILATDQTVADEYMTDNSFLTARYGSDYTVTFVGGSGEGEVNQSGKSGIMSFQYMINDTDLYDVEVVKEKHDAWKVKGLLLESTTYSCDELSFSFSLCSTENYYEANGNLNINDTSIPVIVSVNCSLMTVENAELRQQYEKAWEQFSVTDVENMSSAERQQWDDREKACTMFTCSVEPQFDSFTAVINSDYADFFDNTVNTLHFHEIEP